METTLNLKDTKILIPEIPKEWTNRMRSSNTNIWNDRSDNPDLPEVRLDPPIIGLYAERFKDGWYWVCGCSKCLENDEAFPYIVCHEHDRCLTCQTHRSELTENPWGVHGGFQCKPCRKKEHDKRKEEALRSARKSGHSEEDCHYISEVLCPRCGTENSSEDMYSVDVHETKCHVCDIEFKVEVEHEVRYTSTLK